MENDEELESHTIVCVVLKNETILIGDLIKGSLDDSTITLTECGGVIAKSEEEEGMPPDEEMPTSDGVFYIRDFLGDVVDDSRTFTFRTENIIMMFVPTEPAIGAYFEWRESESMDTLEMDGEDEDEEDEESSEDNVIQFSPSEDEYAR